HRALHSFPTRRSSDLSLLVELCECSPEQALARLEATPTGLTEQQVERRQEQYGLNEVSHEKPPTWYHQLFEAFLTPFNGVLFARSEEHTSELQSQSNL